LSSPRRRRATNPFIIEGHHASRDDHGENGGGAAGGASAHSHAAIGHNGHRGAAQWQTPHLAEGERLPDEAPDLDQIEAAFVEAFAGATDSIGFLKLAGVVVSGHGPEGDELHLLRVEIENRTDVGALSPLFGGGLRYSGLADHMVSRRRRLLFIYFDGVGTRRLTLGEARALRP
jgi:hypothetical protein